MKLPPIAKILLVLLALTVLFIFSNSIPGQQESLEASRSVRDLIRPILEVIVGEGNVTDHLVRKLAHFVEFGLLGTLAALYVTVSHRGDPVRKHIIAIILLLLVAASDEFIQKFTNRGSQLSDVMLDFSGAITGFIAVKVIYLIYVNYKKRKARNESEDSD